MMFSDIRRVHLAWLVAAVVVSPMMVWGYTRWPGAIDWTARVHTASGGLVTQTLQLAGAILVVVLAMLVLPARMRWDELGLRRMDLRSAAVYMLVMWGVVSAVAGVIGLAIALAGGGGVRVAAGWLREPVAMCGRLLAQLAGNALLEEVVWRGLLVPQVYLLLMARTPHRPRRALLLAGGAAAVLFALSHIPIDVAHGLSPGDHAVMFLVRFVSAVLLTVVWLRSGNLLIAVVCHALMNEPSAVFACGTPGVLSGCVALGTLGWTLLGRGAGPSARR